MEAITVGVIETYMRIYIAAADQYQRTKGVQTIRH